MMGVATLPSITAELITHGMAADTPALTVADAGLPGQASVTRRTRRHRRADQRRRSPAAGDHGDRRGGRLPPRGEPLQPRVFAGPGQQHPAERGDVDPEDHLGQGAESVHGQGPGDQRGDHGHRPPGGPGVLVDRPADPPDQVGEALPAVRTGPGVAQPGPVRPAAPRPRPRPGSARPRCRRRRRRDRAAPRPCRHRAGARSPHRPARGRGPSSPCARPAPAPRRPPGPPRRRRWAPGSGPSARTRRRAPARTSGFRRGGIVRGHASAGRWSARPAGTRTARRSRARRVARSSPRRGRAAVIGTTSDSPVLDRLVKLRNSSSIQVRGCVGVDRGDEAARLQRSARTRRRTRTPRRPG